MSWLFVGVHLYFLFVDGFEKGWAIIVSNNRFLIMENVIILINRENQWKKSINKKIIQTIN